MQAASPSWFWTPPSAWTRLAARLPYILHQIAIWYLIAAARKDRPKYIFGLHAHNLWALGINMFFILLHIAQTRISYDGLAQDVPELTSMMSVVLMLFVIMLMENRRRGLCFGKPVPMLNQVGDVLRRYHGYYISWAIIYTFWYHPIEITSGHLIGTFYMMLLLLQSSLFFTRFHVNRWWTATLEIFFVFHGSIVAYFMMQDGGGGPWSMFLFGGIAVFLITQLHGLGLNRMSKWIIAVPLIVGTIAYYLWTPEQFMGLPRQLLIRYIGVFVLFGLLWLFLKPLGLTTSKAGSPGSAYSGN